MIAHERTRRIALIGLTMLGIVGPRLVFAVPPAAAETYTGPVKQILLDRLGWEVDIVTKGNFCLVESGECQKGRPSSKPGGFEAAKAVAVNGDSASPHYGHVYVTDTNHRVQEFEANGTFVSMFGVSGGAPGQLDVGMNGIAVDPASGDVYVTDSVKATNGDRVQKFTAGGVWVWEIGKDVNKTKVLAGSAATQAEKDLCTQAEAAKGVECTSPAQYQSAEPGEFEEGQTVVAVGGNEDLLYVGAGARIQKFATDGSYKGQIALAKPLEEMTLDDSCRLHNPVLTESTTPTCAEFDKSYGDLYVVDSQGGTVVHKLAPGGQPLLDFPLSSRSESSEGLVVSALAVDSLGRLAVSEGELTNPLTPFGSLLNSETGLLITGFEVPPGSASEGLMLRNLAFSSSDEMFGSVNNEILFYHPVHVAELVTRPASCALGPDNGTSATFQCTLHGEANPEEVPETEVWSEWGPTSVLGEKTPVQRLCTITCGKQRVTIPLAVITIRPNQTVYDRVGGRDQNVKLPELITGETISFITPIVRPRVIVKLSAPFVRSSSVVLFGELNPENAPTEYFVEYGTVLAGYCDGTSRTQALRSTAYGKIGATLEATGLQPATTYRYRLCALNTAGVAEDEHGGGQIPEATFTTAPASVPTAVTGGFGELGATSATISGSVNPNGEPAAYTFELGVFDPAGTQYGVVFSGSAPASSEPVPESLALRGLQPGMTYAYRIGVKSGFGQATGAPVTFTPAGLPAALITETPLAMLAVPSIAFPVESKVSNRAKCKRGYTRDRHGKCVKSRHKKMGKRARRSSRHGARTHLKP
jgi:hypothetical protein